MLWETREICSGLSQHHSDELCFRLYLYGSPPSLPQEIAIEPQQLMEYYHEFNRGEALVTATILYMVKLVEQIKAVCQLSFYCLLPLNPSSFARLYDTKAGPCEHYQWVRYYALSVVGPGGKLQGIAKVGTSIPKSSVCAFFLLQSGWLPEACRSPSGSPVSFSGTLENSFLFTSSGHQHSGGLTLSFVGEPSPFFGYFPSLLEVVSYFIHQLCLCSLELFIFFYLFQ